MKTVKYAQIIRSGGNAGNSAQVLQQLGLSTHIIASRAGDIFATQVFTLYGI